MISPWQNPLPIPDHTTRQVVVYFYNGRWIPIMFFSLVSAIQLHRKAQQSGSELFIFPVNLNPDTFECSDQEPIASTGEVSNMEFYRSLKQKSSKTL